MGTLYHTALAELGQVSRGWTMRRSTGRSR